VSLKSIGFSDLHNFSLKQISVNKKKHLNEEPAHMH